LALENGPRSPEEDKIEPPPMGVLTSPCTPLSEVSASLSNLTLSASSYCSSEKSSHPVDTRTPPLEKLCTMLPDLPREQVQKALERYSSPTDAAAFLMGGDSPPEDVKHDLFSAEASAEDEELKMCICCEDNLRTVRFNCGHMVACEGCSKKVEACPTCRERKGVGLFLPTPAMMGRQRTFLPPAQAVGDALTSDVPAACRSALDFIFAKKGLETLSLAEVDRIAELVRNPDQQVSVAAARVARELVQQLAHADDAEKRCAAARLAGCLPVARAGAPAVAAVGKP
jgi:hypothetical protein